MDLESDDAGGGGAESVENDEKETVRGEQGDELEIERGRG